LERHSDLTRKWLDREWTNREDGERWWHTLKVKDRRRDFLILHSNDLIGNEHTERKRWHRLKVKGRRSKYILILHSNDLIGNKQTDRKRWHILKAKGWRHYSRQISSSFVRDDFFFGVRKKIPFAIGTHYAWSVISVINGIILLSSNVNAR
jgi:hypothetical protein